MKYGYFDQENREYIITRPDTPTPWVNYLGSPAYGGIISNHAGGYSFVKSGAKGRILRYRFNSDDKPGRYIYLRDDDNGDFWSASWQPVAKTDGYENRCRHGLGYTTMETEYTGIASETTYYVPLDQAYEVWTIKVKNHSQRERRISIFGYAEFTSENDYEQDSVNLSILSLLPGQHFMTTRSFKRSVRILINTYHVFLDWPVPKSSLIPVTSKASSGIITRMPTQKLSWRVIAAIN